jgi:cell wall assembly regulator SMI1
MQTNTLPNHCYQAIRNDVNSKNVDFHVKFNSDVRGKMNYDEGDVDSVAKTDELLCDLQRTSSSNMLDGSDY